MSETSRAIRARTRFVQTAGRWSLSAAGTGLSPANFRMDIALVENRLLVFGCEMMRFIVRGLILLLSLSGVVVPSVAFSKIRPPLSAGQFYPADPAKLYGDVEKMMTSFPAMGIRGVHAIVVPHAGYKYSGEVAGASFRQVSNDFERVFILASNHKNGLSFRGPVLPDATSFAIPGAEIPLAPVVEALRRSGMKSLDEAHSMHMIELALPFLVSLKKKSANPNFSRVPLILGQMDTGEIQSLAVLLTRYADDKTLFVFSVDLSHYYPADQAEKLDQFTIRAMMSRDPEDIARATTDGNHVLLTLLNLAAKKEWEPSFLKYRHSGDATGDRSRVVGYASIVFHDPLVLTDTEKEKLLYVASQSVRRGVNHYPPFGLSLAGNEGWRQIDPKLMDDFPLFNISRGTFVTLKKGGILRGCIGDILPDSTLLTSVTQNAMRAALNDPRFSAVTSGELNDLT